MRFSQIRRTIGSQKTLANFLCLDKSTIAKWENGIAYPRPATAAKVAQLLGITIDELYKSIDESKKEVR